MPFDLISVSLNHFFLVALCFSNKNSFPCNPVGFVSMIILVNWAWVVEYLYFIFFPNKLISNLTLNLGPTFSVTSNSIFYDLHGNGWCFIISSVYLGKLLNFYTFFIIISNSFYCMGNLLLMLFIIAMMK